MMLLRRLWEGVISESVVSLMVKRKVVALAVKENNEKKDGVSVSWRGGFRVVQA